MSTRCNVIIKSFGSKSIVLYHHHDGYPAGVGLQLRKALNCLEGKTFKTNFLPEAIATKLVKNQCGLNDETYEIDSQVASDIDYLYEVSAGYDEWSLKCWKIQNIWVDEWSKMVTKKTRVEIPTLTDSKTMYEK